MSTRTKKNAAEAAEENAGQQIEKTEQAAGAAGAGTKADTAEEKAQKQAEQINAFLEKLPNPCVYCGPSVRNVARQYTVYSGGIPDVLKAFVMEHPAAKGLLVSVERFAQVRIRLETKGTAESILFNKVLETL